jgi:hypothetical protein
MFLMSSPSGGTKRFHGLPSIDDCPRMEGNYLQAPAVRQALAFRSQEDRGFPVAKIRTWATQVLWD